MSFDLGEFAYNIYLVYLVILLVNILLTWIPRIPYNPVLSSVINFINEVTNPYLNIFRRILPPVGGGGFALDLSPIIPTFVLIILRAIIVSAIQP